MATHLICTVMRHGGVAVQVRYEGKPELFWLTLRVWFNYGTASARVSINSVGSTNLSFLRRLIKKLKIKCVQGYSTTRPFLYALYACINIMGGAVLIHAKVLLSVYTNPGEQEGDRIWSSQGVNHSLHKHTQNGCCVVKIFSFFIPLIWIRRISKAYRASAISS